MKIKLGKNSMTYQEKKELYEAIMIDVAKVVKRRIMEANAEADLLIDLNAIPEDKIRAALTDLEREESNRKYYRADNQRIYESSFTEDIETIRQQLGRYYGIADWQVEVRDLNDTDTVQAAINYSYKQKLVEIVVADINRNQTIIDTFMKERGYELIRRNIDVYEKIPATLVHLIYTPVFQQDIRNDLMQKHYIYHATPSVNKDEILKNGLIPSDRKFVSGIVYKHRTYFFTDGNIASLKQYVTQTLGPEHKSQNFVIIVVDMHKVPQDVEFFYDPLFGKESVYTKDVIPPVAISGTLDLNSL